MEIDLKELIIKVLKESRDSLSPFQIFNSLVMKDHMHHSNRDHGEIEDIRLLCKFLAHDGILIEKEPGKYVLAPETGTPEAIVKPEPGSLGPIEVTHHHPRIKKINRQKKTGFLDLYLGIILIILSILFILIPPYNETLLRIIFALPFLLFLPGYFFITSMFPKKGELSPIERFTLSIGLSIAIFVFDGFALNYTPWGFRPNSIVISLSLIDGIFLLIAIFQRIRLKENAYDFSFENVTSFYRTLISKEQETGPEYDPALEKMLIKTMVIAILIVSAMLIYAIMTREQEKFTAFYILGSNGKAEDYPSEIYINKEIQLLTGIENYEYQPVNYTLRVQLDNRILKEQPVYLKDKEKWLENVTFTPRITSSIAASSIALSKQEPRSKLEFVLLKDNRSYRSVHLWVKPIFDINDFTPSIIITNSDMEQTSGWNFKGSNENITGSFTNSTWISPSYSYMINFTDNNSREYGEISQNVTVDKESIATLSFYVKDSYPNMTSNVSKQVLIDRSVVWEGGMGNNSWEKITVPVYFSKNALLTFRVYNKIPLKESFQVWLDDIVIEKYSNTSGLLTPRPVMVTNYSQLDFKVRGMPVAMKGNVTIDGRRFPGFFYDIDENVSYEQLDLSFSDDHTIETGKAVYTSTPRGNEITMLGSTYKIIKINTTAILSRVLMKDGVKTMNINEKWTLENGYSLSLKLVSSDGNNAMLELRKGSSIVDSKVLGIRGVFEYKSNLEKNTVTVFKTKIDSITLNSIKVSGTELYSDKATILKTGDSNGDFEITNISSSRIIMENSDPIKIEDNSLLLGGNIKFTVKNDLAYPYTASGEIRGAPQSISKGATITINGSNYPGFQFDLDNNVPLEELSMSMAYNGTVDTGNAVYRSQSKGNELYFLGNSYWIPNPERINIISGFSSITNTIPRNGSFGLENGFTISLKEMSDDGIGVYIKGNMTSSQRKLFEYLNSTNISGIFRDYLYEMFTTTFKKGRLKSNIVYEAEDEFEYWEEYREDRINLLISGKITEIDGNNVTMEVRTYQMPIELLPGMSFGEFEIESFSQGNMVLRNTKALKFEPGTDTPILGDIIRIRASAKEPIIYPIKGSSK
ncbi:MAG: DUF1616 domain-containing protein [Candidatus Methanoperedens sp.]|nr:DUF1616 domain-containing protein [Candidatus Methanoperedens sp.]